MLYMIHDWTTRSWAVPPPSLGMMYDGGRLQKGETTQVFKSGHCPGYLPKYHGRTMGSGHELGPEQRRTLQWLQGKEGQSTNGRSVGAKTVDPVFPMRLLDRSNAMFHQLGPCKSLHPRSRRYARRIDPTTAWLASGMFHAKLRLLSIADPLLQIHGPIVIFGSS